MPDSSSFQRPLRLLIVGGSGFLSGTLARVALERGHDVTVVTRGLRPAPSGVTVLVADRGDREPFARVIAAHGTEWDLVVDAIPYSREDARQDVEVFAGRARRFVFVSTDFVYDPARRTVPQTEHNAFYANDGYGGRKREAERLLEQTPTETLAWTILRPAHIYGPGSRLGCLPLHSRDPELVEHIRRGRPLHLVGGGRFLQHAIFVGDLAETILDCAARPAAVGKILNVAGPDIFESSAYYRILGGFLGCDVSIEEVPVAEFLIGQPDKAPFCCDRVYDLSALRAAGFTLPATTLERGLRLQWEQLAPAR
jgi:nucleoside-diphosphate-sugar epimerase